jgi:hypothetical protein
MPKPISAGGSSDAGGVDGDNIEENCNENDGVNVLGFPIHAVRRGCSPGRRVVESRTRGIFLR